MCRIYLLYWCWMIAGGLLGPGVFGLVARWPFLLVGPGMTAGGLLFPLGCHQAIRSAPVCQSGAGLYL
jgi:hypothetical protein